MANPFISPKSVALVANVSQGVAPSRPAQSVTVRNLSASDLFVYGEAGNDATRFAISAGFERLIPLSRGQNFYPDQTAFYLKCAIDTTVELLWT